MVCSVSAGKSGPKWLDRLRSSRGFPSGDADDLENFLSSPCLKQPDPIPDHKPDPIPPHGDPAPNRIHDNQYFDVMSNVLFELFNYGDSNYSNFPKIKKSCRKQSNPKICSPWNNECKEDINVQSEKGSRSDDDNSHAAEFKASGENLVLRENEDEGDGNKGNLLGFSKTEVTVIDTSYKSWKFEKLLFRKKNVWKARDKKGSSLHMRSKKKRKQSPSMLNNDGAGEKKHKVADKEGSAPECEFTLNDEVHYPNNKPVRGHEKAVDASLKKKQADPNLEKGSTPVVIIKSIPPSKKSGASMTKNCIKSKHN